MASRDERGRFVTGHKRLPGAGRKKGTPNRVTREVKEFLAEVVNKPAVQAALESRLLQGDTTAFFRAVELVHGKPRQSLDVNHPELKMFVWPDGDDIAEE